ncbi:MAG: TorF family putative porin [Methylobacillus sp.]|jgi:uncharacterized protein (TIGR02001 family)|nr:TorF family putative porin [Methylobacillus sp.]
MKHARLSLVTAALLGMMSTSYAYAAEEAAAPAPEAAPAEPASDFTLTTNIGFFGQYVFRGITYTNDRPAVQGGFDLAHSSGAYLGVWGTNVDKDALYGNTLEVDLYGGFANTIGDTDFGYDFGFLYFYYPDNDKPINITDGRRTESPNTLEVSAAGSWKWFTLKYSYAVTDFFGINNKSFGKDIGLGEGDTDGSDYIELNFNYTLPMAINLTLHAGHQRVEGHSMGDYDDYLIGISKDFSVFNSDGWTAGLNYTTTSGADDDWYVDAKGRETSDDHVILYLMRTF